MRPSPSPRVMVSTTAAKCWAPVLPDFRGTPVTVTTASAHDSEPFDAVPPRLLALTEPCDWPFAAIWALNASILACFAAESGMTAVS